MKTASATVPMFRVVYLGSFAYREYYGEATTLDVATKALAWLKRQGRTVWIETEAGAFFPVAGAKRKPSERTPPAA